MNFKLTHYRRVSRKEIGATRMGLSRNLKAGDVVRIGSAVLTCLNGSNMRVQIDAPRETPIKHDRPKKVKKTGLRRKTPPKP